LRYRQIGPPHLRVSAGSIFCYFLAVQSQQPEHDRDRFYVVTFNEPSIAISVRGQVTG
jgi:hypothetical protein